MQLISKYKIPRTIFISSTFPPFVGGSVALMNNLFSGLDTSKSILVNRSINQSNYIWEGVIDKTAKMPDISQVGIRGISKKFNIGSKYGIPTAAIMTRIPEIVKKSLKAAKDVNAEVVMSCWPTDPFVIAGWITARKLKLPHVVYLHDLWLETRIPFLQRLIAKFFEPRILKSATKTLVITAPLAIFLKQRLNVNCDVLEHSVNTELWPLDNKVIRIRDRLHNLLMLGNVNKFNRDTVVAFSKAISSIPNIRLTILTSQSIDQLEQLGLDCRNISCHFCPQDKLKETILKADGLYLALGFNTPVQKEVEVVIPTRLMDYLPTGIPIIVHGPANIWTIQEASKRGWGYVIDELGIESVTKKLKEFLSLSLQEYSEIVSAAWEEAKRRDNNKLCKLLSSYLWKSIAA